jgi:hypothetical protein
LIEGLIRQLANPPQRMTGRDPLLDLDVGEQGAAALLLTAHQNWGGCPIFAEAGGFFSKRLMIFGAPLPCWMLLSGPIAPLQNSFLFRTAHLAEGLKLDDHGLDDERR